MGECLRFNWRSNGCYSWRIWNGYLVPVCFQHHCPPTISKSTPIKQTSESYFCGIIRVITVSQKPKDFFKGAAGPSILGSWSYNPKALSSSPPPCQKLDLFLAVPSSTPLNSQLVYLLPVGILNIISFLSLRGASGNHLWAKFSTFTVTPFFTNRKALSGLCFAKFWQEMPRAYNVQEVQLHVHIQRNKHQP